MLLEKGENRDLWLVSVSWCPKISVLLLNWFQSKPGIENKYIPDFGKNLKHVIITFRTLLPKKNRTLARELNLQG